MSPEDHRATFWAEQGGEEVGQSKLPLLREEVEAWIAEILPRRGVSDVRPIGPGVVDSCKSKRALAMSDAERNAPPRGASRAGSKMSPATKAAGKVSGVDLNNWWP